MKNLKDFLKKMDSVKSSKIKGKGSSLTIEEVILMSGGHMQQGGDTI